jgi:Tryptophan halogenase
MQPVKAVVIAGGGTAGWLTGRLIAARHQSRMKTGGLSVTLIESADIRIIGVGERHGLADAGRARGHGRQKFHDDGLKSVREVGRSP